MPETTSAFGSRGSRSRCFGRRAVPYSAICLAVVSLAAARGLSQPAAQTQQEQQIEKAAAKVMSEGIDLFVDRLVLKKKSLDDDDWATLTAIYRALDAKAKKLGYPGFKSLPFHQFPIVVKDKLHEDTDAKGTRHISKRIVSKSVRKPIGISECLIVCSGPVEAKLAGIGKSVVFANGGAGAASSFNHAIIIANADIDGDQSIGNSVVITAGSITCLSVSDSVLIARGDIHVEGNVTRCHISATGKIEAGAIYSSTALAGKTVESMVIGRDSKANRDSTVRERAKDLPELIKFFDPASLGIHVKAARGGVKVTEVLNGPFTRAGIKPNDLVVAVDNTAVEAAGEATERFRNLVRRAVVQGCGTLSVHRNGERINLPVTLSD